MNATSRISPSSSRLTEGEPVLPRSLETLFDWLSEPEGNYRLDVIELCCEWAEYDDAELLEDFGHLTDSGSRSVGELLEALNDETDVLAFDGGWLVRGF